MRLLNSIILSLAVFFSGSVVIAQTRTQIDLTSQVKGILPIANGGTGDTLGAWQPPLFGSGAPSGGLCVPANYNRAYYNAASTPYQEYLCINGSGWVTSGAAGSGITALTGDGNASGTGSVAFTLVNVNGSSGACGDATHVCAVTTNSKGLVTAQSAIALTGTMTYPGAGIANSTGSAWGTSYNTTGTGDVMLVNGTAGAGKYVDGATSTWTALPFKTLTTTGSGAATLVSGTLNVPTNAGISALTGDGTASGTGSVAFTLATVNGSSGACGDATHVCAVTTNGKGLVTAQTATSITQNVTTLTTTGTSGAATLSGGVLNVPQYAVGGGISALTGDGTASGTGSVAFTLATVNGSSGACGDATHVCAVTTNGKGLVTAQTATSITQTFASLTTTGTSGAATLSGGILNVPNYNSMVYPAAGIANSTGSAWGTSYGTIGTGSVVLANGTAGAGKYVDGSSNAWTALPFQSLTTTGSGAATLVSGTLNVPTNAGISALTGDGTASGTGSVAFTLATVNGSSGACGDATHVCAVTTNGKGLVTAQTATSITQTFASLTTTGTSGAATLSGGVLNVPNYGGSGASSVSINGVGKSAPNFNSTTPATDSGFAAVTFNSSSNSVSAEVPTLLQPSNTNYYFYGDSLFIVAGSCVTGATMQGTITAGSVTGGVLTATATNTQTAGNYVTLSGFGGGATSLNQTVQILSTGLSSSQFEANVTGGFTGSTGAGNYTCTYSVSTQASKMASFQGHGTVINGATGGATTYDLATNYSTTAHNYSPAVTGNPAWLVVIIGTNNWASLGYCSLSGAQGDVETLFNDAHADGYKVMYVSSPVYTGSNIYCSTGDALSQAYTKWARGCANSPDNACAGAYWDSYIDVAEVLNNNSDSALYITTGGDVGHFSDAGAHAAAELINQGNLTQASIYQTILPDSPAGNSVSGQVLYNLNGAVTGNGFISPGTGSGLESTVLGGGTVDVVDQYNAIFGYNAGNGLPVSSNGNVAIGANAFALDNGSASTNSIAIGNNAAFNGSVLTNTIIIGASAAATPNMSGDTIVGYNSGNSSHDIANSVLLGDGATGSTSGITDLVAIGYGATSALSHHVELGGSTITTTLTHGVVTISNATVGEITQTAANSTGGSCQMATSTSCTITLGTTYTTPICVATVQSATPLYGGCTVSGTTVTITASSSNSAKWGALVFGNPN